MTRRIMIALGSYTSDTKCGNCMMLRAGANPDDPPRCAWLNTSVYNGSRQYECVNAETLADSPNRLIEALRDMEQGLHAEGIGRLNR